MKLYSFGHFINTLLNLENHFFEKLVQASTIIKNQQRSKILKKILFFEQFGMTGNDIEDVAQLMEYIDVEPMHFLFRQGDPGDYFYIIVSGSVEVIIDTPDSSIVVATLKQGQSFGELALITDAPRRATIKTLEKCSFAMLNRANFQLKMKSFHDAKLKFFLKIMFLLF